MTGGYTYKQQGDLISLLLFLAYFPWYDTDHIENDASNNSSVVAYVFVTAVTFQLSRCLAAIRVVLPSRCLAAIGGLHRQQRDLISLLYIQPTLLNLKK
jgi:hypothetical protein